MAILAYLQKHFVVANVGCTGQLIRVPQLWFQYLRCVKSFSRTRIAFPTSIIAFLVSPFLNPKRTFLQPSCQLCDNSIFIDGIIWLLSRRSRRFIPVSASVGRIDSGMGIPASKCGCFLNGVGEKVTASRARDGHASPFTIWNRWPIGRVEGP